MPTQSTEIQGTILSSAAFKRASAVAQNVRYEDGSVCAAPGYIRINLSSELLQGIVAYWSLGEAMGTRFDATPNYNNLTDVPGVVPDGTLDLSSTAGIIGAAALFPGMPFVGVAPLVHDSLFFNTALFSGFVNPLIKGLPNDLWTFDTALSSGAYASTVIITDSPEDEFSFDGTVASGAYVETVVGPTSAPEDEFSLDTTLTSGTYTLVIVVADSPEDEFSFDTTLVSGSYTETIVGPDSDEDKFSFDCALASGSYS